MEDNSLEKKYNKFIVAVSIIIPVVVAILFGVKLKDFGINVEPLSFLPPIYATINGITAIVLVLAVMAIKKGKRKASRMFNDFCYCVFGCVFGDVCCLSYDC